VNIITVHKASLKSYFVLLAVYLVAVSACSAENSESSSTFKKTEYALVEDYTSTTSIEDSVKDTTETEQTINNTAIIDNVLVYSFDKELLISKENKWQKIKFREREGSFLVRAFSLNNRILLKEYYRGELCLRWSSSGECFANDIQKVSVAGDHILVLRSLKNEEVIFDLYKEQNLLQTIKVHNLPLEDILDVGLVNRDDFMVLWRKEVGLTSGVKGWAVSSLSTGEANIDILSTPHVHSRPSLPQDFGLLRTSFIRNKKFDDKFYVLVEVGDMTRKDDFRIASEISTVQLQGASLVFTPGRFAWFDTVEQAVKLNDEEFALLVGNELKFININTQEVFPVYGKYLWVGY